MKKLLIAAMLFSSCEKDTIEGCIRCEQRMYKLKDTESREVFNMGFPKITQACDKPAQQLIDTIARIPTVELNRTYHRYILDTTNSTIYQITTRCEQI
jgi:hypothetical protein